ncbi:MAG: helix-turn-helix transcriptional regulator [Bacteroidetes bacterium]|nr:helix-turn-helix transcriptional regulator [Bacteroidota bacterium]
MQKAYASEIKKLGKRIKKLREEKQFSQQELAGFCDVDIRTIQRIEKGEFGTGLHIMFAIADAFEMSISELFNLK